MYVAMYHTHRISSINTGSLISTIVRYYLSTNSTEIMLTLIIINFNSNTPLNNVTCHCKSLDRGRPIMQIFYLLCYAAVLKI